MAQLDFLRGNGSEVRTERLGAAPVVLIGGIVQLFGNAYCTHHLRGLDGRDRLLTPTVTLLVLILIPAVVAVHTHARGGRRHRHRRVRRAVATLNGAATALRDIDGHISTRAVRGDVSAQARLMAIHARETCLLFILVHAVVAAGVVIEARNSQCQIEYTQSCLIDMLLPQTAPSVELGSVALRLEPAPCHAAVTIEELFQSSGLNT